MIALDAETVLKVFRRQQVTDDEVEDPTDHEVVLRAVWDSECAAYELLSDYPDLARFTPSYFGRVRLTDVHDENGNSVGSAYLLDCAYRLQRVYGKDVKIGTLDEDSPIFRRIDAFLDTLNEIGVRHPYDSSVFIPGASTEFTVIDIATWEAMAELSYLLVTDRRLPEVWRRKWAPPGGTLRPNE